uniref:ubiquitinyl hydrolase 1 n=1 Tax=Guillardia theta TaxID=55529 RepID=A0A7S4P7C5_GUITH
MASALQMFRCVPELLKAICNFEPMQESRSHALSQNLIEAMKLLFMELTERKESVSPLTMVHHLRNYAPQFAEVGMMGPAQQDAEECLSTMLQALIGQFPGKKNKCLIRELFQIGLKKKIQNSDPNIPEESVIKETTMRLPLIIDAKTNTIHDSIQKTFSYEIQKHSTATGVDATYNVSTEITELPPYLFVHFVRFFWRNDTQKKAKICRDVHFPVILDLLPYCSPELKNPIARSLAEQKASYLQSHPIWGDGEVDENERKWAELEQEEIQNEIAEAERLKSALASGRSLNEQNEEDDDQFGYGDEMEDEIPANSTSANTNTNNKTSSQGDRLEGCSSRPLSSIYELRAVLTHQGRFADAGHYIAWIKTGIMERASPRSALQPMWLKFDDEKISLHPEEEVKKTSGGSEGPIAYLCLYGRSRALAEGLNFDDQIR